MTKVIGVRFRTAGKIYFFSPGKLEVKRGDQVIVETARGVEFGNVVTGPKEVEDDQITQPLKTVIRVATEEDQKACLNATTWNAAEHLKSVSKRFTNMVLK